MIPPNWLAIRGIFIVNIIFSLVAYFDPPEGRGEIPGGPVGLSHRRAKSEIFATGRPYLSASCLWHSAASSLALSST